MKSIKLALLLTSMLGLTACIDLGARFMYEQDYLEDDSGNAVGECTTEINPATDRLLFSPIIKSWAKRYWEDNNLPKGTLYFICDGSTPLLPKDCQGNELTTPQLRRYWKKYDLPISTYEFNCRNGVPSVPADS
ncbi:MULTISPECIES: hypothetical protein [unclassified Psychrobacter]|uniref:hypothetical protein n=1 Tax=unclassified Psychrobacter TaxID=196806 RepID=UPI0017878CE6|nr:MULTISPECIES: hypothetical protein [unclassified Psychrobacter]MBE0441673.1 hypothetical protein [Psychrobacter sp. FME13]